MLVMMTMTTMRMIPVKDVSQMETRKTVLCSQFPHTIPVQAAAGAILVIAD